MLIRLTLQSGQRPMITGREIRDLVTELEDPGAGWLVADVLEYDGKRDAPADWRTREVAIPHGLIMGADELTPAELRDIPQPVRDEHGATL